VTAAGSIGRRVHFRRRAGLVITLWAVAGLGLPGCTAGSSHRVLSFFFDGVPPLAPAPAPAPAPGPDGGAAQQGTATHAGNFSKHAPFAKKQCDECHITGTNNLVAPVPELCFRCHKFELAKKRYVHAPVVSGFCRLCHDPHNSRNPFLLVIKPEELCYYCHNAEDVYRSAAHRDREEPCLKCHNPHADNRYFLKADRLPTTPAASEERPAPE
jgi:predicted CXXCH cytochrome family protein